MKAAEVTKTAWQTDLTVNRSMSPRKDFTQTAFDVFKQATREVPKLWPDTVQRFTR